MSNRINPVDQGMLGKIGDKIGQTGTTKKLDTEKSAAGAVPAQPSSGDTVELTRGAQLLEQLDKTLAEVSAIDSGRVEAVRTAIQNGDYSVDAEKIADALLRYDQEFRA